MGLSLDELICLYLHERPPSESHGSADRGLDPRSPTGIAAGIGIDPDDIRGRIDVFEAVTALTSAGYLSETVRTTADGYEQNVYEPSARGRERARELRRDLLSAANGVAETDDQRLHEVVSSDSESSLATVLARLFADEPSQSSTAADDDRFVGRSDELATLTEALATIQRRGGQTLFVTGERGVGKSTLCTRLLDRARQRSLAVGRAACRRDTDEPYGPLRRAIESAFDASVCAPLSETATDRVDDAASLSARQTALLGEVAEGVCTRSTGQPTVLFVDDLQWADASTIALFERLATESTAWVYPVLLLGAYRPGSVPDASPLGAMRARLADDERIDELAIEPFDRLETGRFVRQQLGDDVPETVIDRVHEAAGGTPLIVDEAVTAMVEPGSDSVLDDAADAFEALDVPAGAERAIERRLAPLDDAGTQVLSACAVVGRTIPYAVVRSIVSLSDPDLREYVRLLVDARILEWADEPDARTLAFSSDLVREIVRSGLSAERRRVLHAQIADALVQTDAPPATIAHHCEEAGQLARAIDHYEQAGSRARRTYAGEAALEKYERALELADRIGARERTSSIHLALGVTRFVRGEYDAAADHFATARDRTDDVAIASRARHRLAEIQVKRGDAQAGIATAERGLAQVTDTVPAADRCRLHRVLGWGRLQNDDLAGARSAFERQLDVAESVDDPTLRALARHDLGTLDGKTGDVERAEDQLTAAVSTFERVDEPNHRSKSLTNLALVYRRSGRLEAALETNERALSIQREYGYQETLPDSLLNKGELHRARGTLGRAVEAYEAAIDVATDIGREERAAKARANLAMVLARQGRLDLGRHRCEEAIETFERLDATDGLTLAYTTRAYINELAGEYVTARADATHGLTLAREIGNDERIGVARNVLGRICRATGTPDVARTHHEAAAELAADGGNDVAATRFRIESVADMLAADGAELARRRGEKSVAAASETGERLLTARARARYGWACCACGDYERATTELQAALETQQELGVVVDRCETLLAHCDLERAQSRPEAAADALDVATALIEEYGLERYADRARTLRRRLE